MENKPVDQLTFFYSSGLSPAMAGVGAIAGLVINILADAEFLCKYLTCQVLQASVIVANWGGTIQINDSAAGRTFFNVPTLLNNIRGDGQLPYPLSPARMFARNSTITIDLVSNVATSTTVEVVLHGVKIYQ